MNERKIIISLIVSTEFCQKIKDIWNLSLLESSTARLLATWIWEYYNKYQQSPGRNIESIFQSKVKDSKIAKEIAEEIEQEILPSLSSEYAQEEFNLEYVLKEAEKYFNERHLKLLTDNVNLYIARGEPENANKIIQDFKPLSLTNKLDNFVLSIQEIKDKNQPHSIILLHPWLRESQTNIIYGTYGSGKSLLVILIAYILGLQEPDKDSDIGKWYVKNQTGTFYVDGELGEKEMVDRVKQFEWVGKQQGKYRMRILSIPDYQLRTEDTFSLSQRSNQLQIVKWLKKHTNYKLIILDSISTLFGLEAENDNSEWNNKINPLLRDLRAMNVACILLHHSGKDGKRGLRGASAMGAMAHNIFCLKNHEKKNVDNGEAWFTLTKDKQRSAGFSFRQFSLKFYQNDEKTETYWDITENY